MKEATCVESHVPPALPARRGARGVESRDRSDNFDRAPERHAVVGGRSAEVFADARGHHRNALMAIATGSTSIAKGIPT